MTAVMLPPVVVDPVGATPEAPADSPPRDPRWTRPALAVLLVGTAVLYLWNLGASGDANSFYAAAVQAGSESWKSWFFGSIDTSNFITVDKPPAALWVMGLSARIFGYSSWSLLAPQAIEGVLAVWLLFSTVRRVAGARAGLISGAVLALTPAAALMFRFDNPDAFLLLMVVAATYCVTRAIEKVGARWFVLAGVALGFAFLAKSAQALLVVPPLGLAYVVAAPSSVLTRIRTLALGVVAMVVSAGWWFAAVSLWPASDRPYIGGSTDNNPLELAFGYNGLARLFGGSGNGGGGGGAGGGNTQFGGATGLGRMFTGEFALEISWLLPAALIGMVALLVLAGRGKRTDPLRAAAIIWGGSLLVTGLTFSFMQGTIHPYYSVALAPSIGALVGLGVDRLWHRGGLLSVVGLMLMTGVTAVWGFTLLHRESGPAWVEALVVVGAVAALVAVLWRAGGRQAGRRGLAALALATIMAVGAPAATWAVETANTAHSGSIPTAVSSSGSQGFGGGGFGGGGDSSSTTSALTTALAATTTTWAAATVGAQSAASLELGSDTAVMAIGGFTGSDPSITLAQFKALVAAGDITYFVPGGGGGGGGGFGGGAGGGTPPTGSSTTSGTAPTGTAPTGNRPDRRDRRTGRRLVRLRLGDHQLGRIDVHRHHHRRHHRLRPHLLIGDSTGWGMSRRRRLGGVTRASDDSGMTAPVTVSITRHLDPGHEPEMVSWMQAGIALAGRFDGFLGGGWVRPEPGSETWHVLYRFADDAALQSWEHSHERDWWRSSAAGLGVVDSRIERRTGIEGWFDEPVTREETDLRSPAVVPPRWKQACVIWSVFFPINLFAALLLREIAPQLEIVVRVLITTLSLTPVMTYLALPFMTRKLSWWLNGQPAPWRRTAAAQRMA